MAALIEKKKIPAFRTEAQEAAWWDAHKTEVEKNLLEAMRKGTARRGTAQSLIKEARASKNITIRMPLADLERARHLSAGKGLAYQTYMKMLLHEALVRDERHAAK